LIATNAIQPCQSTKIEQHWETKGNRCRQQTTDQSKQGIKKGNGIGDQAPHDELTKCHPSVPETPRTKTTSVSLSRGGHVQTTQTKKRRDKQRRP
jgi:hypothetical protein